MPLRTAPLPRMAGHLTFMRIQQGKIDALESGQIGLVGVPREGTASTTTGYRFGPNALRETSVYFGWHANPQFSRPIAIDNRAVVDTSSIQAQFVDLGDVPLRGLSRDCGDDLIQTTMEQIAERDASALVLGGDAGIVPPVIKGISSKHEHAVIKLGGSVNARSSPDGTMYLAPYNLASLGDDRTSGHQRSHMVSATELHEVDCALFGRRIRTFVSGRPIILHLDVSALNSCWHGASDMPRFNGLNLAALQAVLTEIGQLSVAALVVTGLNPTRNGLAVVKTGQRLLVTALLSYVCARLGLSELTEPIKR